MWRRIVGAKKNNISQIDKYLKGQLDNKAMHQLEREAQDDPFFTDALDGYENQASTPSANLGELKARLDKRVAENKNRSVLLWRTIPIAACLLLMIGGGYWFLKPKAVPVQYSENVKPVAPKQTEEPNVGGGLENPAPDLQKQQAKVLKRPYIAENSRVKGTIQVDELSKKMESIKVDTDGRIDARNNSPVKARLNGKDYTGGTVAAAIKNLPKEVIEKTQIIDDYGDQVAKAKLDLSKPVDNPVGNKENLLQGRVNTGFYGAASPVRIRGLASPTDTSARRVYVVSGKVTDSQDGTPLVGATIAANGKGLTQADINGNFTVVLIDKAALTAMSVGYQSQELKVDRLTNNLNIKLSQDTHVLNERVIRGYIPRKRDSTTGSSYIADNKAQDNPVGNVEQLLQGKVANLNIQNNNGEPVKRGSANIRLLRGAAIQKGASTYMVTGIVTDRQSGKPIQDAVLTQGGWGMLKTDSAGKFTFINIGKSLLTITKPGYVPAQVKLDDKADLAIALGKDDSAYPVLTGADCKENLKFKARFFDNITVAERYTREQEERITYTISNKQFLKALKFISHYTLVHVRTDLKGQEIYYTGETFRIEKTQWLKWYEEHKCLGY